MMVAPDSQPVPPIVAGFVEFNFSRVVEGVAAPPFVAAAGVGAADGMAAPDPACRRCSASAARAAALLFDFGREEGRVALEEGVEDEMGCVEFEAAVSRSDAARGSRSLGIADCGPVEELSRR
jgi:hypothetical protein